MSEGSVRVRLVGRCELGPAHTSAGKASLFTFTADAQPEIKSCDVVMIVLVWRQRLWVESSRGSRLRASLEGHRERCDIISRQPFVLVWRCALHEEVNQNG